MPALPRSFRYFQIREKDRQGDGKFVLMFDGADALDFTPGDVFIADKFGGAISGGPPSSNSGGYGSPYQQVPIGIMNLANTEFFLDYIPLSFTNAAGNQEVWIMLQVNGDDQDPYFHLHIDPGSNRFVMRFPPKASDKEMVVRYFRGIPAYTPPPPGVTPPPSPPPPSSPPPTIDGISLTLTVTTAYTGDPSASNPLGRITIWNSQAITPLYESSTSWNKRTQTFDITPLTGGGIYTAPFTSPDGIAQLKVSFFAANGTFLFSAHGLAIFQVFDCLATMTYPDGSTYVFRPSIQELIENASTATMIENPNPALSPQDKFAIDEDIDTYAEMHTTVWGNFGIQSRFQLSGFGAPVSAPPVVVPAATLNIWADYPNTVNGLPAVSYSLDGGLTWTGGDGTLPGDVGVQV